MDKNISFTLKVWRQKGPKAKGAFETYQMKDIPGDTSFLEMLDILNEQLISEGKEPVVFDHGKVVDSSGEPVIGANILLKGTSNGTITDMNGIFRLSGVSRSDVLVVTFMGYKTVETPCAGKTNFNIVMVGCPFNASSYHFVWRQ